MKKILKYLFDVSMAVFVFFLLHGCGKDRSFSPSIAKFPEFYGSISLPAVANPVNATLIIGQADTSFTVNAVAVGDHAEGHTTDIKVSVKAMPQLIDSFNTTNGTNYAVLPQEYFTLDGGNAVIKAGKLQSSDIVLGVSTKNMTKDNKYLLPIGITAMDNPDFVLNSQRRIVFFIIEVKKPQLGQFIMSLSNISNNPFACFQFGNNLITFSYGAGDGVMRKYKFDEKQDKFGTAEVVTNTFISTYNYAGFNAFIPISSRYLIIRDGGGDLYGLDGGNIDNNSVSFTNGLGAFKSGFQIFDIVLPYKGNLLGRWAQGSANQGAIDNYRVDTTMAGALSIPAAGARLATGWDSYVQIIPYVNGLLCVEADGDLWYLPVSESFKVSERQKVGSGWNIYKKIVAFGNDLLGIDSKNDVYRFKFDISKQWDL